ncbi:MAG: extracellular solute-binding protein [Chloroflexi bacterium]|nr:extracellular solute-binding protein [Chloroflexota bacterium]
MKSSLKYALVSRRRMLTLCVTALGTVALASCGQQSAATSQTTSSTTSAPPAKVSTSSSTMSAPRSSASVAATPLPVRKGQTEIQYWFWGSAEYTQREQQIATGFMKQNPDIVVQPVNPGNLYEKLLASFAGNTPPDSTAVDLPWVIQFGDAGVLIDLAPRIHQDKEAWLSDYLSAPIAHPMYHTIYQYKGSQILALTGEASPNLIFYNADLFRAKGLQTPYELYKADQWTWDNFVEAAKRLTVVRPDGAYEVAGSALGQTRLWMNTAGGEEFDDIKHPSKCLYGNSQSVQALGFLQDAMTKDKVIPVPSAFTKAVGSNADDAFMHGKLAMQLRWTTGIGLYKNITQFKWGMVPYPKKQGYVVDYATGGPTMVGISKGRSTNDAAWSFAKYKCGPDGLVIFAKWGTGCPFPEAARQKTLEVHKSISSLETPGVDIDFLTKGTYDHIRLISKDQSQINSIVNKQLGALWTGQSDAQMVGQQITDQVDAFLKQHPQ